jgi:hypothetical protein
LRLARNYLPLHHQAETRSLAKFAAGFGTINPSRMAGAHFVPAERRFVASPLRGPSYQHKLRPSRNSSGVPMIPTIEQRKARRRGAIAALYGAGIGGAVAFALIPSLSAATLLLSGVALSAAVGMDREDFADL